MSTRSALNVTLTRSGKKVTSVTLKRGGFFGIGARSATIEVVSKPEQPHEPLMYIPADAIESLKLGDREELRRLLFATSEDFRPAIYWPAANPPPVPDVAAIPA